MSTCFVMQPFDGGPFDRRYAEVVKPAIESAGLEPYRVDQDPAVNIPIDEIERGIREARVCIADITEDNPNVWFELGYAISSRREVVLICSDARESPFPFDVQHRSIIKYSRESPQDFSDLREKITKRLEAVLRKEERLGTVSSPLVDVEGLSQHETVALVALAENLEGPGDWVGQYTIRQDMERSGFTRIATFLALTGLLAKQLVDNREEEDFNGNAYVEYQITQEGTNWLLNNQQRLALWHEPAENTGSDPDDDIPF